MTPKPSSIGFLLYGDDGQGRSGLVLTRREICLLVRNNDGLVCNTMSKKSSHQSSIRHSPLVRWDPFRQRQEIALRQRNAICEMSE